MRGLAVTGMYGCGESASSNGAKDLCGTHAVPIMGMAQHGTHSMETTIRIVNEHLPPPTNVQELCRSILMLDSNYSQDKLLLPILWDDL